MLELIVVFVAGILVLASIIASEKVAVPVPGTVGRRIDKLWEIAQNSLKDRRYLRAEKALLTILKIDQKNAAAYNHLGILYSRQREFRDAIECFEIASSIKPSAATLHNLGLVYFETENYEKAAVALESALHEDNALSARRIAYAKVLEKLGRQEEALEHMIAAVKLEPSLQSLKLLQEMYKMYGHEREAAIVQKKLDKMQVAPEPLRRIKRPRRVIY